jgi:hypothetical protein
VLRDGPGVEAVEEPVSARSSSPQAAAPIASTTTAVIAGVERDVWRLLSEWRGLLLRVPGS